MTFKAGSDWDSRGTGVPYPSGWKAESTRSKWQVMLRNK